MAADHQTATSVFGGRLRRARKDRGLTLNETAILLRARLPKPLWVTLDPIRRMEIGTTTEEKADPVLVRALADIYGKPLAELSPLIAEELELVERLLRGEISSDDVELATSRCTRPFQPSLWDSPIDPADLAHAA